MLESPATDPGRAAEGMQEVRYLRAVIDTLRQELVTERKLVKGFEADLIAARKERDEATRLLRVLNEETVLAGYPCGDRDRTLANVRALRSDLVALAKMYGEVCGALAEYRFAAVEWQGEQAEYKAAVEEEAAQLRARLHEAEKGKTVDLDTAMKRGIRSWSAKLHIPVTRMMSRVLREEIHAALTPAPEANQEAGDGR